jgi:hypothetical protein
MEYHVKINGNNEGSGSVSDAFKTISKAAQVAQSGDTINIHEGIYREWVNPINGGTEDKPIIYRAASGEKVIITGAEIITAWENVGGTVWKTIIPNSFFGSYNPYKEIIFGDWLFTRDKIFHTGEVYLNGKSMYETVFLDGVMNSMECETSLDKSWSVHTWFCAADDKETIIWANFHGEDPRNGNVEINVRPFIFWPMKNLINYITVKGFNLKQAATNWAPPTALQTGLIGPHWAKGWIIEDNIISDSKCSGISLGKEIGTGQNEWYRLLFKQGTQREREVIFRAARGNWNKETIGSHIVRNNTIFDCEQTGIVGHLGAVFSLIENNHIYRIQHKRQFNGAETGGIKLHAAIDTVIRENVIHDCNRGLWLDWQAQGTHVTRNIFWNNTQEDFFVEVSHGPYLVDHNLFLSSVNYREMSQGGAFVHNLFTGKLCTIPEMNRFTPYHFPHETEIMGVMTISGGDVRFYNNLFIGDKDVDLPNEPVGIWTDTPVNELPISTDAAVNMPTYIRKPVGTGQYDDYPGENDPAPWVSVPGRQFDGRPETKLLPVYIKHNVYLKGAMPYIKEPDPVVKRDCGLAIVIDHTALKVSVKITEPAQIHCLMSEIITTELLGRNHHTEMFYEEKDGNPYVLDKDFTGRQRSAIPAAGPFEVSGNSPVEIELSYRKK